ncbi:Peptidoglycan endopeptidase RipA precursor [Corynebacterium ciconiae DSM 44920]|uniref:DIP1281 family NlpC/P60 protein n=1 Tax=Corynebacterium ciconiae TaxID=227319 RepID=UPI000381C504|nr:NlpC/P60 family protein [Corynebacterium ciconiae]WKD61221.1 Peptidoglycan endopeptidase RipA precursor [Corynebacterium ciconiae DSM 44920]
MATSTEHRGRTSRRRARRALMTLVSSSLVCVLASTSVHAAPSNPSDEAIADAQSAVDSSSQSVAQLANTVAEAAESISAIENEMGALREAVNKALVDLQDARAVAELSRQHAQTAREELDASQADIAKAQELLNEIARSAYRRSAAPSSLNDLVGSSTSDDALDRLTYLRQRAEDQQTAIRNLDALRTAKANAESLLRQARQQADEQLSAAEDAEQQARDRIDENSQRLEEAEARRSDLMREQAEAQARLDAARGHAEELDSQREEYEEYQRAEEERQRKAEEERKAAEERRAKEEKARKEAEAAAKAAAEAEKSRAEEREKARKAAEEKREAAEAAKREAEAAAKDEEKAQSAREDAQRASQEAAEAVVAANEPDHTALDNPYPTDEDADATTVAAVSGENTAPKTNKTTTDKDVSKEASEVVSGSRQQKIEAVIARAESQLGVPYAWGGGNANGPTLGIRDGGVADAHGDYNKVGFDCSGLTLYAFAGVGISLPHYSGYQYQRGTKVSPSQMQRGDLIFYGTTAQHHVAIYLGDGMMIEAPQSGSYVKKSPVRWGGMSPYVVRLI